MCLCLAGSVVWALSGPDQPFVNEQPDSLPLGESPFGTSEFTRHQRFVQSSSTIAWASAGNEVFVRNATSGLEKQTVFSKSVRDIDLSASSIAVLFSDGTAQLLTHDLEPLTQIDIGKPIRSARLSPSQQAVHCWVQADAAFVTVSENGSVERSLHVPAQYIVWDSTNNDHAIAVMGGGIALVDLELQTVREIELVNQTAITAADHDETTGAIALGFANGQTQYFDGQAWSSLDLQAASMIAAIHADGYAAVAGEVHVLDWERQRVVGYYGRPASGIVETQMLIDEDTLTTVSSLGVRRWQIEPSH
ncbi:MAG: hypothetical protein AAGB26_06765 [Planctomycetota bacterium]